MRKVWTLPVILTAGAVAAGVGYWEWRKIVADRLPSNIATGNGRIEATEIDVATKIPGRVREILVNEGDFIESGQMLARMDTAQLEAQKRQAEAQERRAIIGIDTAKSLVAERGAERRASEATISQRQAVLDNTLRKLDRSSQLVKTNSVAQQTVDDDRAAADEAKAGLAAAQAQLAANDAALSSAKAAVVDAEAAVDAAHAAIDAIAADIADATLTAPRPGRVQYRVAEPGEVLSAGGRVLNMVDLGDVYMTFFLPTAAAGRVGLGAQARIVLDAAPAYVIPAKATFVSDVAQFTPKTVETEEERQKLMFRIKAQIAPDLLKKYIAHVKTGLPGVAYVRLDASEPWPQKLETGLVR